MLDYIKNGLQAILTTLESDLIVTIQKTNSLEKKINKEEDKLIQITYRELPSMLPKASVKDRLIRGELIVVALEEQKEIVEGLFELYLDSAHNTFNVDRIYYFSNLQAFGVAENIGSKVYQTWRIAMDYQIVGDLSTLKDVSITIDSKVLTYQNGLLAYDISKTEEFGNYPVLGVEKLIPKYTSNIVTFRILDIEDDFCEYIRGFLYGTNAQVSVTIADKTDSVTFNARLVEITKSAKDEAYSTILVVLRRA